MSNYLFAEPSFLSGVARLADIFGTFDEYNESLDEVQADAIATRSDWRAVGDDLKSSVERFVAEVVR